MNVRNVRFLLIIVGACAVLGAQAPPPTLIISNARIYTMDARQPTAEAVAIRGNRIAAVGASADILRLKSSTTRVVDAHGATIVPGLQDAHGHVVELGQQLQQLDLRGTTSYEQIIERVRQRAAAAKPGEWILGHNWDQNDWNNTAFPTHEALSAAAPNNPVYLTRVDGHAGLANAKAMAAAGVSAATKDPAGGRIIRGAGGRPSGVVVDAAQDLITARIPSPTAEQVAEQVQLADREARRVGLTMVHDAGVDPRVVELYRRLMASGTVKTRVYVMLLGSLDQLTPAFRRGPIVDEFDHRLAVRAIKIIADGALGSRGAALLEPYSDEPGNTGLLTTPPEVIYQQTLAASRAGFQTAVHAIGDRANREVLDIFERVEREVPAARNLRLRVEHAQILDAADIPRFARLDVIASMQPTHATSDMPWVPARIGRARMQEGAYVWRKILSSGARFAAGSDFPVEEPNPLLGFYAAITRQDRNGQPAGGWMPEQRLTRDEALRAFTLGAAYAANAETFSGSLEAGKLADLVMLSRDIMQVPPRDILTTTVRMTMVGGEVVYEDQAARATR